MSLYNTSMELLLPGIAPLTMITAEIQFIVSLLAEWLQTHAGAAVLGLMVGIVGGVLYQILYAPISTFQDSTFGYQKVQGVPSEQASAFMRRWRDPGEVPPPYPNGWYCIIESWLINNGESKAVSALGTQFAVFRDESGEVHALDAYCPHVGAHLGVGGAVKDDCLQCPFHGWKFRGTDGVCVSIPYSTNIPSNARVRSWPVLERNHHVYLWWHADPDFKDDPQWLPDVLPEVESGAWRRHGMSHHYVSCHVEEISANGADVAHLPIVHENGITAGSDIHTMKGLLGRLVTHNWGASWEKGDSSEPHAGYMRVNHDLLLFKRRLPGFVDDVVAKQMGPGVVYLTWKTPMGRGMYFFHTTPIEPMLLLVRHSCYMYWPVPRFIAKVFLRGENIQFERDIFVWNSKRYNGKPIFTNSKEDATILKHRRWFKQFYTKHSLDFKQARRELGSQLDW